MILQIATVASTTVNNISGTTDTNAYRNSMAVMQLNA